MCWFIESTHFFRYITPIKNPCLFIITSKGYLMSWCHIPYPFIISIIFFFIWTRLYIWFIPPKIQLQLFLNLNFTSSHSSLFVYLFCCLHYNADILIVNTYGKIGMMFGMIWIFDLVLIYNSLTKMCHLSISLELSR